MRRHLTSVIFTLALATVAMAADSNVGTWKLNIAKSKFESGPAPKGFTVTIQAQDNGVRYVLDGVDDQGKAMHQEWTVKYDGKDYPLTGDPSVDTAAFKRIDANTADFVLKKRGKEASKGREVISTDGKRMTVTESGKNDKGETITDTMVFDKQ